MKLKELLVATTLMSLTTGLGLLASTSLVLADSNDTHAMEMATTSDRAPQNMFGGPVYVGEPALPVTLDFLNAGGGAENFDFATSLVSMLGEDAVNAEVAKLTQQYGEDEVAIFIEGMNTAVGYALDEVAKAGITLPEPKGLKGAELAEALVRAGMADDGTFWAGLLFDVALSHDIHNLVMNQINKSGVEGYHADKTTHKILNQAMYDVGQALGITEVQLADLH